MKPLRSVMVRPLEFKQPAAFTASVGHGCSDQTWVSPMAFQSRHAALHPKIAGAALLASLLGLATPPYAQNAAAMSCGALWQERNTIYAHNGYCFQTPRAVAVFGRGCFPPFGKVSGSQADRVNELQYWERQRGC